MGRREVTGSFRKPGGYLVNIVDWYAAAQQQQGWLLQGSAPSRGYSGGSFRDVCCLWRAACIFFGLARTRVCTIEHTVSVAVITARRGCGLCCCVRYSCWVNGMTRTPVYI